MGESHLQQGRCGVDGPICASIAYCYTLEVDTSATRCLIIQLDVVCKGGNVDTSIALTGDIEVVEGKFWEFLEPGDERGKIVVSSDVVVSICFFAV